MAILGVLLTCAACSGSEGSDSEANTGSSSVAASSCSDEAAVSYVLDLTPSGGGSSCAQLGADYDGAVTVVAASSAELRLGLGDADCELTFTNTPSAAGAVPVPLPNAVVGTSLWFTSSSGLGMPYSGESHQDFALRGAEAGSVLLARQRGSDASPSAAIARASALGLDLALDSEPQCSTQLGTVALSCFEEVTRIEWPIRVEADEPLTVLTGEAAELTIDGISQVFAVETAATFEKTKVDGCTDGRRLTGEIGWILWTK